MGGGMIGGGRSWHGCALSVGSPSVLLAFVRFGAFVVAWWSRLGRGGGSGGKVLCIGSALCHHVVGPLLASLVALLWPKSLIGAGPR